MESKLISVIVPVYKVEKYLDQCVESIVNQTYRNLEIILVDDGSPDRCPQMCDEWAKKDSRIKVIHKKNGGASSARNAGLDIAMGDYIGFVDSDDYIAESMYATLLEVLLNSEYKISCCIPVRVCETKLLGEPVNTKAYSLQLTEALNAFFYEQNISSAVWDKLFERNLFTEIKFPVGETNEEYPMFIPLIIQSGGITHTGQQLYFYRVTEGSVTSSTWKTNASILLKHLLEMEEQLKQYRLKDNIKAFRFFCAKSAYSTALHLDKNYDRINEKAKENQKEYIRIMSKHCVRVMISKYMTIKDKILYLMVVTRSLRPIYRVLGRL